MISIILPVLNEEKTIEKNLIKLNELDGDKEVIIVDGGSRDKTKMLASKYGSVYESSPSRAKQMNLGAKNAKGEVLWFVHSDSIVDRGSLRYIEEAIKQGCIGGGFELYFYDFNTKFMKFVAKSSNSRAKRLGLYFGDQGIFMERDLFDRIGGYPDIPIMEDWEMGLKLRKIGKMSLLKCKIGTSARRFKTGGTFKTLMLMHKIKLLYILGVSPERLVKIYKEAR